jgi:hypothetical protein
MKLKDLNDEIGNIKELKKILKMGMVKFAKIHGCISEIEEQVDSGHVNIKEIKGKLKKINNELEGDI